MDGVLTTFVTGDHVVFDETASTKTVTINEEVVPKTVSVIGNAEYTINGDGGIRGNADLTKEGNGTLTINNINPYTGKTIIEGGVVKPASLATAQSAGSLGALSKDAANFVIQNGAQMTISGEVFQESPMTMGTGGGVFNVSGTLHLKGTIKGSTLTKNSGGTLYIYDTPNTYKKTILNEGTLNIAEEYNSTVNGMLGDTVVLNGGTLQCKEGNSSYSKASWHLVVPAGKTATIRMDGRCNYTGSLTGAGTLNVYIPFVRSYLQGDWSKFEGTVSCSQSTNGDFTFDNNYGMPLATLNVESGCSVRNNKGSNMRIGAVTGTGTLGGTHGWTIGKNDAGTNTFEGVIEGSLTKVGSNTLRLEGANVFTGATAVKGGTMLVVNTGKSVSATGTGDLTIYAGSELTGRGYIGNKKVVIANGGIFRPGLNYIGRLTVTSDVELQKGGVIEWRLNSESNVTTITGVGEMVLNGTIRVVLKDGVVPELGHSFELWNCEELDAESVPLLELPELPEGLAWDTTDLFTSEGILRVIDAAGIRLKSWNEEVRVTVVTLDGVQVDAFKCAYNQLKETLDATSLPQGFYLLKIEGMNGSTVQKILKQYPL